MKQGQLTDFFERSNSFKLQKSSSDSDDDSQYLPSKQKKMFEQPMYWTRVKELDTVNQSRMTVFDVEQDIKADKSIKQIRKGSVRDLGKILFDPEDFKDKSDQLTFARHSLNKEQLFDYAQKASRLRNEISEKASQLSGQDRVHTPKDDKQFMPESFDRMDFNPSHPKRKRRVLKQLSSDERLHIAKQAASK